LFLLIVYAANLLILAENGVEINSLVLKHCCANSFVKLLSCGVFRENKLETTTFKTK